jgi:rhomboid protease GluP
MKTVEKRRMCPNCRAFITISDRVCPYCGAQLGPRAIDMRGSDFVSSFLPRANLTAIIILAINLAFFLAELALGMNRDLGVAYAPFVFRGQWWRLLTAGFLHGGWLHIAMNSWSLFILVTEVEQFYGTSRFLVAYIFYTFIGFLMACVFSPRNPVLGASCAAFGLIGVMLAMGLRNRADPLAQAVRAHYGQWLIFGLLMSLGGGISLSGHIGGLIGGFIVGLVAGLPGLPGSPRETFWKIMAASAVVITLYAWLQDFRYLVQSPM